MIKRTLFSIAILLFAANIFAANLISDTSYTDGLTAFDWSPISDVEKVLQYENQKDIKKRTIDNVKKAKAHYIEAYKFMINKEYGAAITEFKATMKIYNRAKLSNDALNFIHANMALSYASTGNKEDLAVSKRFLGLITSKAYTDPKWTYNIAIAHNKAGNANEAASLLSLIIRKDEFYFQAYVTLEAIYRNSGNGKDADKVVGRMQTAEAKLMQKNQKTETAWKEIKENKKKEYAPKGKRPDVTNLKIVTKYDHLQFNKKKIEERSMNQIQKGIAEYSLGVKALSNKEYSTAQKHLKNTEKGLKRGKVTDDGLNFTRGNLAISYLAADPKRGGSKAKRYLKYLTPKIYKTREWTYNMAVVHFEFADATRSKTIKEEYMKAAVKLFKTSIRLDKLYLPAYENLVYIYRKEFKDGKKALKIYNAFEKARNELIKSFSKQAQIDKGHKPPFIFRINLGTFGEFDTPSALFEEDYLITIPEDDWKTTYLSGLFYTLDEARAYQESKKKEGYTSSFIVAFKEGEEAVKF